MRTAPDGFLTRAVRFLRMNGPFLLMGEIRHRTAIQVKRAMYGRRLGCSNLVLGAGARLRGIAHIRVGRNFQADDGLWLEAVTAHPGQTFSPSIVIGDDVSISKWTHIAATSRVEIGDGTLIGSKVLITDHNHGQYREDWDASVPPALRPLDRDRPTVIGKNVWLCDGVVVTPGSIIGDGAVIGANSVVVGAIPPGSIAVGSPARCIRQGDGAAERPGGG
jgi:acetyltransferase-like isoleucine patch superfamily enzyme